MIIYLLISLAVYGWMCEFIGKGEMFKCDKLVFVIIWPVIIVGFILAGLFLAVVHIWEKLPWYLKKRGC